MQRLVHGWFVSPLLCLLRQIFKKTLLFCAQKQTLSLSLLSSCSRVAHRRVSFSGSRDFHFIGAPALVEASGTEGENARWHQKGGPEGTTTHRGGCLCNIFLYYHCFIVFLFFVRMSCMMLILLLWFRHDFDWWWMWVIGFEGTTVFRMRKSFDYRIYMEQLRKIKVTLFLSHVRDPANQYTRRVSPNHLTPSRVPGYNHDQHLEEFLTNPHPGWLGDFTTVIVLFTFMWKVGFFCAFWNAKGLHHYRRKQPMTNEKWHTFRMCSTSRCEGWLGCFEDAKQSTKLWDKLRHWKTYAKHEFNSQCFATLCVLHL